MMNGAVSLDTAATTTATVVPLLQCLARGEWSIWRLEIGAVGVADGIPLGFKVCLDAQCAKEIAEVFNWRNILAELLTLGALAQGPQGAAAIIAVIKEIPPLLAALTGLAGYLGLSLGQAIMLVVGVAGFLGYHALAVAGQILLVGDARKNGVCLQHPLFVLAPALPVVAMNTPLIVTARG